MLDTNEQKRLCDLVSAPSVGAVLYQAYALTEELKAMDGENYPEQAFRIRNVFLSIVDYIQDELGKVLNDEKSTGKKPDKEDVGKLLAFALSLRCIYRNLRALRASGPNYCPRGIQAAIAYLASHFLDDSGRKVACLARTQPMYMATYFEPVKDLFKKHFDPLLIPGNSRIWDETFDSDTGRVSQVDNSDVDGILHEFWERWLKKIPEGDRADLGIEPPTKIAIISFGGLDDHDALLYSVFAHEIAHFIDFGSLSRGTYSKKIIDEQLSIIKRTERFAKGDQFQELANRLAVFLREIFADLLATRMLGFPYFIALAELLKTMGDWKENSLVLKEGYPNIHLRLAFVLQHLCDSGNGYDLIGFMDSHKDDFNFETERLMYLLREWQSKLKSLNHVNDLNDLITRKEWSSEVYIDGLIIGCLPHCLSKLIELAKEIIPASKRPVLGTSIFERIKLLDEGRPPSFEEDTVSAFHDIMFAAWAYQIIHGEGKEFNLKEPQEKYGEYVKTCKLVVEALNEAAGVS